MILGFIEIFLNYFYKCIKKRILSILFIYLFLILATLGSYRLENEDNFQTELKLKNNHFF